MGVHRTEHVFSRQAAGETDHEAALEKLTRFDQVQAR
jgi:hypothetical protein